MFQVAPHALWLGHAGDCRDVAAVMAANLRAVVQLAIEEPPVLFPREIIFLRIPLLDGADNAPEDLRLAVDLVEMLLARKIPSLLCCGGGMSRSPAIAAVALARLSGATPADCLQQIRARHGTDVSVTLWRDLLECEA